MADRTTAAPTRTPRPFPAVRPRWSLLIVLAALALGSFALNAVGARRHRRAIDKPARDRRRARLLPEEGPVIRAFQPIPGRRARRGSEFRPGPDAAV